MQRIATTLIAGLLLISAAVPAQAGWWQRLYHSMRTDFHRNNEWPYTFVYADRQAAWAPFEVMAYNGWRVQNTIGDYHFDSETGALTEAGRIKIAWIMTQAPEQFRTIYVQRAESSHVTVERLEAVREVALAAAPEGTLPDIAETSIPPRGTPADYIAGIHAWIGALAAIAYRASEGRGQHVDVSLAESAACADEYNAAMYGFQGAIRRRYYSRHVFGYPMDIMPCKDGYIVLVPGASGFPQRGLTAEGAVSPMALLMGDPNLDQNPLFGGGAQARMIRWQEVDALLMPWLMEHEAGEIVELAQALRMPFAPVPTVKDLIDDEHLSARSFFRRIDHPQAGEFTYAGAPFRMSETPPTLERAPMLGEHNASTLQELGYSEEEQTILRERDVT